MLLPKKLYRIACFGVCLITLLLAGCGGKNETPSAPIPPPSIEFTPAPSSVVSTSSASLVSISIAPGTARIAQGVNTAFVATATYADGTTSDMSKDVTWSSDNIAVATINSRGFATGVNAGSSAITAKLQSMVSNVATLTVTYSLVGTLNGLAAGSRIKLTNNGIDSITLTANGAFSFPVRVALGGAYDLSIAILPARQPCTHTYGAGKVQGVAVPTFTVICGFPARGEMVQAASLGTARRDHTATLLISGKILATGGVGGTDNLVSAELFDPNKDSWSTTGELVTARRSHTATLLHSGRVLAVGGMDTAFVRLASAELFDSDSGRWTTADSLNTARSQHTATLLPNGQVLVTGGVGLLGVGTLSSAELYDPITGHWTATGSLATARSQHSAVLLPSGKVLVIGGVGAGKAGTLSSAELYDPATGIWSATGGLVTARSQHTTTLLPNGKILVAGGIGANGNLDSAELYNPATGHWSVTGSLTSMRYLHTALLLPTGKILVTGGIGATGSLSNSELFDPNSGRWAATGSLAIERSQHTATLLSNGKMLVVGGNGKEVLSDSELFW